MKESHVSRRAARERRSIDSIGLDLLKKTPMTPNEVRGKWIAAIDELNHFFEKHKDLYLKYKEDFEKIRGAMRDPYLKRAALEELTLSKYPRLFREGVRLYSNVSHWQEQAARYKVDDKFVLALPEDIPYWLQFLQGYDHKYHPNYEPVKGKVFLPSHLKSK